MDPEYLTEIEHHFAVRRGTPFLFSHKDVALITEWAQAGIPLPIVIEAMDSVFDKAAERQKMVNSLRYCRHAVKELWNDRRELQIGAQESAPEESVEPRLDALASSLETSPLAAVADFGSRVRALASEKSVPRIEERLMELEEELITALAAAAPDVHTEVARLVGSSLDEKTRARTEAATLRRVVRERFDVPRLTLFR